MGWGDLWEETIMDENNRNNGYPEGSNNWHETPLEGQESLSGWQAEGDGGHQAPDTGGYQGPTNSGWKEGPQRSAGQARQEEPRQTSAGSWSQDPFSANKAPQQSKKKNFGAGKIVALCLVCALIGALVQPVTGLITGKSSSTVTLTTGDRAVTQIETITANTNAEMSPAEIYASYVDSTVGITVDIVTTNIFGQTVKGAAAGSGFVITADGYILTNYHVIQNANAITVAFVDGVTYPATLIGGEEANDIAVIKIDADGLTPVVLGSSGDMRVGESVVAIGNPLGELTFTETQGIISALNRTITMSDGRKMNMIQTDCAINSGNSGGPLFNHHGEVIGIVSAKYSSGNYTTSATVEGLGFAIPMDDVADMVKDLIEMGYVTGKPYLGLIMDIDGVSTAAQAYGVPAGVPVLGVTQGLAAQKAGIQAGDIITKVDGEEITSSNALSAAISEKEPDDQITLTIYRNGETLELTATLGEATAEAEAATQKLSEEIEAQRQEEQQNQQQQQQQQQQDGQYYWPFGNFSFGY